MAACTHRVATASTVDAATYASGAFTPAAGELLVAFVIHSAATRGAATTMTDSQGLGFSLLFKQEQGGGVAVYAFVANTLAAASSMTVTFNATGSTTPTGAIIFVSGVSGMTRTGLPAIRQANFGSGALGTAPTVSFLIPALTGNPVLGGMANITNPAALTPPASWTEPAGGDTGYATPTTGGEYVTRDSGFTGTAVTWASNSATAWGAIVLELDVGDTLTPARVGSANSNSTATTLVTTLGSGIGVAVGDKIFVAAGCDTAGTTITVADSKGNTYTVDKTANATSNACAFLASAPCTVALVPGDTITVTYVGTRVNRVMSCFRAAGIASSTPFDASAAAAGTVVGWSSGASGTTVQAAELALAVCCNNAVGTETDTPGGTPAMAELYDFANLSAVNLYVNWVILAATQAVTGAGTATNSGGRAWNALVGTYMAASVAAIIPDVVMAPSR